MKNFTCDQCGKKYVHNKDLQYHKDAKHGQKQYMCDKGNKVFAARYSHEKHTIACVKGKLYKCQSCNYTSHYKSNVNKHLKTHK